VLFFECTEAEDLTVGLREVVVRDEVGAKVSQWREDESSLPHPRVRHDQVGRVNHEIAHQNDVNIEGARPPVDQSLTMSTTFGLLGSRE
jgi:hypothetical protein